MVFSSIHFLFFFLILISLLIVSKGTTLKKSLLLFASIFFYAYWDVRFVPLLLLLTIINFIFGKILEKSGFNKYKNKVLFVGIFINLVVLFYYKYINFFLSSLNDFLNLNDLNKFNTVNVILPLGISFFVFEFISYLVDVYHAKVKHTDNLLDFSTFVFFFPRLASGPIIRPADFLPQLLRELRISKENLLAGGQIFLIGIFKKIVIADRVAVCADRIFSAPQLFDSYSIWLGVLSYSIQIYCDFSGYSDMAIGISKALGINLPFNFNMPYISKNITEFWRRWHISLSSWLRDYFYIPLGGNRKGKNRADLNLMITMLLGGLWHGANWTFICWGGIQGLALVIHKKFQLLRIKSSTLLTVFSRLLTFLFVCVCWVIFRADSFSTAMIIYKKMFFFSSGISWIYTPSLYLIFPIVIIATALKLLMKKEIGYLLLDLNKNWHIFILIFMIFTTFFLSTENSSPFIYFQF